MTNKEMRADINKAAKLLKQQHKDSLHIGVKVKIVEIHRALPTVAINLINHEIFFQGSEADDILTEADQAADKFGVSTENALLWMASGW